MRVVVERSGGFMGRSVQFQVVGEELPEEQRRQLQGFAAASVENAPASRDFQGGAKPDAFHYRLTVETDTGSVTRSLQESDAPRELLEAVHWVTTHGTRV